MARQRQPVDVRTATVSPFSFALVVFLSPRSHSERDGIVIWSDEMGMLAGRMGKVNVKKRDKWKVQSRLEMTVRKVWSRAGFSTSYCLYIPFQSAELLRTCQVLIIGTWSFKAPLSLSFLHSVFSFVSVPPLCSVYLARTQSKCAKQRKQSVTEHFSILLMLQLFPGWFDNINCCPPLLLMGWPEPIPLSPAQASTDQASGRTETHRTWPDPEGQGLLSISSYNWGAATVNIWPSRSTANYLTQI